MLFYRRQLRISSSGVNRIPFQAFAAGTTVAKKQEDVALQWGRNNPVAAQACLQLPSGSQQQAHPKRVLHPLMSWSEYWKWRNWDFSAARTTAETTKHTDGDRPDKSLAHAQALATHVLSAPLTIAHHVFSSSYFAKTSSANETHLDVNENFVVFRCCCVGARAESMLPVEYWKEMLVLWRFYQRFSGSGKKSDELIPLRMMLDFVGPDSILRPPQMLASDADASRLELKWLYRGKLHDYASSNTPLKENCYDAHVFLNPGLGHAHLQDDWTPRLDLLFDNEARG